GTRAPGSDASPSTGASGSCRTWPSTRRAIGPRAVPVRDRSLCGTWTAEGRRMLTLKKRKVSLRCIGFSPDGSKVAAAGVRGDVPAWDIATQTMVCDLTRHYSSSCDAVLFSSEERLHVLDVSSIHILHLNEDNRREKLPSFEKRNAKLATISPDRSALCIGTFDTLGRYSLPACAEAAWEHRSARWLSREGYSSLAWSPCPDTIA